MGDESTSAARRLAAVLAADVVGYSRLMGEDEAGTARAVREHREAARPIVASLNGRIVKATGDGLLFEFPSVVAAVECAIAVQKLMVDRSADVPEDKRIRYRMGVNLGDVLIEGDDILGDGVNIAARLEGICEPGGVLISGTAYDHVRGRVDADFVDLGDKDLKNIARPVRVFAVETGSESAEPALSASEPPWQAPPRLSIVVLPFANLSGDREQEYFVDGVTDSLTTDLSRISGAFVIGRSTAFTYKGKAADVRQIGCELNVRYVLEGSVQRGGNRLRVNVQLLDAETASHIWAERFDKSIADLFDMQDEIVSRLANRLGQELARAEAKRAERKANPDSMDHYFLGHATARKGHTAAILDKARLHYDSALELDPDNVDALVARAWIDLDFAGGWMSDDRRRLLLSGRSPRIGNDADFQQSRRPGHRRMRARIGDRPESRLCSRMYRDGEVFFWLQRGDRGAHPRSLAHQPARQARVGLDALRRDSQVPLGSRRGSARMAQPVDRA